MSHDVIVVGLGAMGSAAAYQLVSRGTRVLGLEAFGRAHELGSSGGLTRIIRLAYFEHADYVPMLRAAWELWPKIEAEADSGTLRQVTGGLYIGQRGSHVLDGSLKSAQTHGLQHEVLDADEMRRRFPAFQIDDDMAALHDPLAGILFPDRCIDAHMTLAERHGGRAPFRGTRDGLVVGCVERQRDHRPRYMPLANGPRLDSRVCTYTNTPDFNFILDFHPADERVVIASPCSGHGFKFSNVIGSIAADLALDGRTQFEIGFLSLDRFAARELPVIR